jgi:hypothetical protein
MSLLVIVSQSPANQGFFFFLFFEKLHNLPPWERKDCTFCECARVVKENYDKFFFGNANLVKEIWQALSRVALKIDDK